MSYEQAIHELEIVLNWLDRKAAALEKEMSATPLSEPFTELVQQNTVINHLYDKAMSEYHAVLTEQRSQAVNRLEHWKALVTR